MRKFPGSSIPIQIDVVRQEVQRAYHVAKQTSRVDLKKVKELPSLPYAWEVLSLLSVQNSSRTIAIWLPAGGSLSLLQECPGYKSSCGPVVQDGPVILAARAGNHEAARWLEGI